MSKITNEERIKIYQERKKGVNVYKLSDKYGIRSEGIEYLVKLIDRHGLEVLRGAKNKYYSKKEKERIIKRVIENKETINSVAIEEGLLSRGMLQNWILKYKENGYNVIERKRGRPIMGKGRKRSIDKDKIKKLEEENTYLKAKIEYIKKLTAVVQARKNQQQKKK